MQKEASPLSWPYYWASAQYVLAARLIWLAKYSRAFFLQKYLTNPIIVIIRLAVETFERASRYWLLAQWESTTLTR